MSIARRPIMHARVVRTVDATDLGVMRCMEAAWMAHCSSGMLRLTMRQQRHEFETLSAEEGKRWSLSVDSNTWLL
jgi:hypothetical protein